MAQSRFPRNVSHPAISALRSDASRPGGNPWSGPVTLHRAYSSIPSMLVAAAARVSALA